MINKTFSSISGLKMANSSSTDSNSILVINTPTYYIKFSVNQLGENNSCVKVEKISVRKKTQFYYPCGQ